MFGRVTKCLGRICLNLSDIGHSKIQWYSSPRTPHLLRKRTIYTNLFLSLLNKTLGRLCFFVRNFVSAILCLSGIVIFKYSEKENDTCKSLYNIQLDLWLIIPNHCCIYWSHNLCLHEVIKESSLATKCLVHTSPNPRLLIRLLTRLAQFITRSSLRVALYKTLYISFTSGHALPLTIFTRFF